MIQYENVKTIYDLIEEAGREFGDKPCLRYESVSTIYDVSYERFAKECAAVRAWCKEQYLRVGHQLKIGIIGQSSYPYILMMMGGASSGAVVIPIDPQLEKDKLVERLNTVEVDVLFYDRKLSELIDAVREECPSVRNYFYLQKGKRTEWVGDILEEFSGQDSKPSYKDTELAMIIYTSGTTGVGKGVMLSHRNLIDNTFCTLDDSGDQVSLNVLPLHHVYCINGDILLNMRYGGVLCLNEEMSLLTTHIQMFQPTQIRLVPMIAKSLYNQFALLKKQYPNTADEELRNQVFGHRLSRIISGGGYLSPELAANYRKQGVLISQGYGMSECSPKIAAPDWNLMDEKQGSVGRIVDRCETRFVDGELQVKSPSVMMGYFKDPENTAAAITEDGWLRTGDVGYLDDDNFLYLTGRKKNLIILSNGENVPPEEIEGLFEKDRIVQEVLVFGKDDVIAAEFYPNFKYAEIAGINDPQAEIAALVKKYNEELPSYKRILKVSYRDIAFEKSSSGKIIRSVYFTEKQKEAAEFDKLRLPENDNQQKIYDAACGVIGKTISVDTDFYEAGLDSMGSVLLISALGDIFKVQITMAQLMDNASVLKLEAFVKESESAPTIDYSKKEVYDLTRLQTYFGYVIKGNTTSNLPFIFKLDEGVDLDRLIAAVKKLFDVHPVLKCVIQPSPEGMLKAYRKDDIEIDVPVVEMTEDFDPNSFVEPFLHTLDEKLYHMGIFKAPNGTFFGLDVAHIIGDGMSMNIIFEDLNRIYAGEEVKPEGDYTFYEYALDEKVRKDSGVYAKDIEYYYDLIGDFEITRSILNRKEKLDLTNGNNLNIKKRFSMLNKKNVQAFCKKNGISENALFLSAYCYCVGIFQNQDDVICSSIHSGRTDSRWERIVGSLFITHNFRFNYVPREKVKDMLKRSGRQLMETMGHYASCSHPDEMFFQYQGDILEVNSIGNLPAQRQSVTLDSLPFHLQVLTDERGYYYILRAWENRFDKAQLEIFMICMESILEAMLTENSARMLKEHLPVTVFPLHFTKSVGTINREAGAKLIADAADDERVKVYVFNKDYMKQPFGGWGDLYVMGHPTLGWTDKMRNPYGEGILYKTGRVARILPDGKIDFLENGGRTVMRESLAGRDYLDLQKVEELLKGFGGIDKAEAYVHYTSEGALSLNVRIYGENEPNAEGLHAYVKATLGDKLDPTKIRFSKIR